MPDIGHLDPARYPGDGKRKKAQAFKDDKKRCYNDNKMKYPTLFHLISAAVEEKKVSCVLIGGFAVNYYKVSRYTAVLDFLITKDDFKKILVLLEQEGYRQGYGHEVFSRLRTESDYLLDIDFMFVDRETLDKIIKDASQIYIAGEKFLVPSLEHLIALKLHAIKHNPEVREDRDLPDIVNMARSNGLDTESPGFKKLCLQYGTQELYDKIVRKV